MATGGNGSIHAYSDVTSIGNTAIIGIQQGGAASAGTIIITADGKVSGTSGIQAFNSGTGAIEVNASGLITGTTGYGVDAQGNGAVTIAPAGIKTANVTAATYGVKVVGGGGGAISIAIGNVMAAGGTGIDSKNNGTGTVTITAGDVSGTKSGIVVRDSGTSGDIKVSAGAVTAGTNTASDVGIEVVTNSAAAKIDVTTTGAVTAGNSGIIAANLNSAATGAITVNATGPITGRFGVFAESSGKGNVTVNTAAVNATTGTGVLAGASGGSVTIKTTGDVTSTGNTAIIARQIAAAGPAPISVTVGKVSGNTGGISAINTSMDAAASVTVTNTGLVTGATAIGIDAQGKAAVAVNNSGGISGGTVGLNIVGGAVGSGDITVTGGGNVTGLNGNGISTQNNGTGKTSITAGDVSSTKSGIVVRDSGTSGDIKVSAGAVTGGTNTASDVGIEVVTISAAAKIDVTTTGAVTAGNSGIIAANLNSAATGAITVNATGPITGHFGVFAESVGKGNVTVNTAAVNATTGNGVFARTSGGTIAVNTAAVTSTGSTAIVAIQDLLGGAGTVTVTNSGAVSGTNGINALTVGTGAVTVNANANVTATGGIGIQATINHGGAGTIAVALAAGKLLTATGGNGITTDSGKSTGQTLIDIGAGAEIKATDAAGIKGTSTAGGITLNIGAGAKVDPLIGVDMTTVSGTLTVNNAGLIEGDNIGVKLNSTGAGAVGALTVNNTSATSVINGKAAEGVLLTGVDAGLIVTGTGAGSKISGGTFGVSASTTGTGNITIVDNTFTGGTGGIQAVASGTGGILISGKGDITTTLGTTINATLTNAANTSNVTVNRNGIILGEAGVNATTAGSGGVLVITQKNVTATNGIGINTSTGGAGATFVSTIGGSVSATGGAGIKVRDTAAGGDITVQTDAVSALSAVQNAVDVQSGSVAGKIDVFTQNAIKAGNAGIVAANLNAAATGDITVITSTSAGTIDARIGIDAENFGVGKATVTTSGQINATSGNGVFALTKGGNVTVTTAGVASTGATAIIAQQTNAAGAGTVSITTNGAVTGTNGISASSAGVGTVTVNTKANVTATTGAGVTATNAGGATTVTQVAATTLTAATDAIKVNHNVGGVVAVNAAGTLVANNGSGVFVNSTAATADAITVTTNIVKSTGAGGTWGSQVRASAGSGDITINSNGAMGSAGAPGSIFGGILALTNGTSNRNITVNVTADIGSPTDGSSASQVLVSGTSSSAKTLAVNANIASVYGGPGAIQVQHSATSLGDIKITGTGTGTLSANGVTGVGVNARNLNAANAGNITVDVTQSVIGKVQGINASTVGGGNIGVTARGNVTATGGAGINVANLNAAANAGTIAVTTAAGKLVTAAGGNGIQTNSGLSTGATNITILGEVIAPGQTGVKASSTAGNITLNVTATGKIDPVIGSDMTTVSGAMLVTNAGLIQGDVTGVKMTATGTGTGTVNNTGTITGGTNAVLGSLAGGVFTITNSGTLNGGVNVAGSALAPSIFTNSGTWNSGATASSFAGNLVNSGVTNIGAGGSASFAGTTTNSSLINFAGTGTFNTSGAMINTGTINAQNGVAGNNQITVGGTYAGPGILMVDVSTFSAAADTLKITGTASGATNVLVNQLARGYLPSGFLLVVSTGGAPASAFTSTTSFATTGIFLEAFGTNPSNSNQFGIRQTFNPVASQLGGISSANDGASNFLDEPASAYVTERTDKSHQVGLWARGGAGDFNQSLTTAFTSGGSTFATVTDQVRTSFSAVQSGLDFGFLSLGGGGINFHFGVTGGVFGGSAKQAGGVTSFEGKFLGGYMFLTGAGFTLDGAVRREWTDYSLSNASLFTTGLAATKGRGTTGTVGLSYRLAMGGSGLALTPSARMTFGSEQIDPFLIDGVATYDPGSNKSRLGRYGAKLSYRAQVKQNLIIEPYVGAFYLDNSQNVDSGRLPFGTSPLTTTTTAFDHGMLYTMGISASDDTGRISGFVQGGLNRTNGLGGGYMSVGARINF